VEPPKCFALAVPQTARSPRALGLSGLTRRRSAHPGQPLAHSAPRITRSRRLFLSRKESRQAPPFPPCGEEKASLAASPLVIEKSESQGTPLAVAPFSTRTTPLHSPTPPLPPVGFAVRPSKRFRLSGEPGVWSIPALDSPVRRTREIQDRNLQRATSISDRSRGQNIAGARPPHLPIALSAPRNCAHRQDTEAALAGKRGCQLPGCHPSCSSASSPLLKEVRRPSLGPLLPNPALHSEHWRARPRARPWTGLPSLGRSGLLQPG
jgi:hypothetical protein